MTGIGLCVSVIIIVIIIVVLLVLSVHNEQTHPAPGREQLESDERREVEVIRLY